MLILVTQIRWKIDATFVRAPTIWDSFNASPSFPSNLAFPAHEDVSTPNVTGNVTEMSTSFPPKWVLVFAPSTSKAATRMSRGIARMLAAVPMDVESEEEVENFFVNQTASIRAHGAVVFDEASFDGDRVRRDAAVKYKTRLRAEQYSGTYQILGTAGRWLTEHVSPASPSAGPRGDNVRRSGAGILLRRIPCDTARGRFEHYRRAWRYVVGTENRRRTEDDVPR